MAFTFQINNDLVFKHDDRLLKKAEANKPEILTRILRPKRFVKVIPDSTKMMGWGVSDDDSEKTIGCGMKDIRDLTWKRGEKFILDFGDHVVGRIGMDIRSVGSPMDAPLTVRFRFAEIPAELMSRPEEYDGWLSSSWIQEEVIHLDILPARLDLPRRYSFRYVEILVKDTSPKWAAAFSDIYVIGESSADRDHFEPAKFEDPELQRIYDVSVKTLEDCMQDVFEDGPKRDRRLWLGDLRLQALANYASFKNSSLVRRCLYLFAAMTAEDGSIPACVFTKPVDMPDDTFLFDYSLFFTTVLRDYLAQEFTTRKEEVLEDLYPAAKKQMELAFEKVNAEGFLVQDEDRPVFIDWSGAFDKNTAGQAVMIYTTGHLIELAKLKQDPDLPKYEKLLERMTAYAREQLFDPGKGFFVSGPEREINIASQVWMVLAGVPDQEESHALMRRTVDELFPILGIATPYMYHHVDHALFKAGLQEEGIRLMKDYWGKMVSLGADTYWEAFEPENADYSPYGDPIISSFCHAWACTPVWLLEQYLVH